MKSGREIPNFFIFAINVVRFNPSGQPRHSGPDDPTSRPERVQDHGSRRVSKRTLRWTQCHRIVFRCWQRVWKDSVIGLDHRSLDQVLKFPHVPRPRIQGNASSVSGGISELACPCAEKKFR